MFFGLRLSATRDCLLLVSFRPATTALAKALRYDTSSDLGLGVHSSTLKFLCAATKTTRLQAV